MTSRGNVLRDVMLETSTTQSELSRLSGVRQPSISGFLSGKVELSDDQLDRLLSCMGFRLEVVRRPVVPRLTRSERRSWRAAPAALDAPQSPQLQGLAADDRAQPRPPRKTA